MSSFNLEHENGDIEIECSFDVSVGTYGGLEPWMRTVTEVSYDDVSFFHVDAGVSITREEIKKLGQIDDQQLEDHIEFAWDSFMDDYNAGDM